MTVTVEQLLYEYMTVVRQNGPHAIEAVAREGVDDPTEITWEIVEVHENLHGSLPLDPIWPLARLAAQMAVTICHHKVTTI
jgi:hypothetical protein